MAGSTQESLLAQLEREWNARDPIGVGRCFRDDAWCEWRSAVGHPTRESAWPRIEGRAAIARCVERVMRMAPQLTLAFPVVSYGSDRRVWAEWSLTASGGHSSVSTGGVAVFGITDHGFTEARLYGDPSVLRLRTRRPRVLGWRRPRFEEGLGTCLLAMAHPARQGDVKRVVGVPERFVPVWLQLLGHPAESSEAGGQRPRRSFEEIYASGRWGTPLPRDPDIIEDLKRRRLLQARPRCQVASRSLPT